MTTDPGTGCSIGQSFGANANGSYAAGGLLGHPAWDESCTYGSEIKALASGKVYSTYSPSKPASDGYTAVYTLCRTPLETFEFSYGHVSEILVPLMSDVKAGDVIAKEGNKGLVYSGGTLITLAMQTAGDRRGSHRHYQKRPVVRKKFAHSPFLQTEQGPYFDDEGYYYEVPMPNNGFRGCVDWRAPLFNRDLGAGQENYYVLLLQRAMVLEGFATYEPTGFFGAKTFNSLRAYQKAHNISSTGYCGPMTRASLNAKYHQLS